MRLGINDSIRLWRTRSEVAMRQKAERERLAMREAYKPVNLPGLSALRVADPVPPHMPPRDEYTIPDYVTKFDLGWCAPRHRLHACTTLAMHYERAAQVYTHYMTDYYAMGELHNALIALDAAVHHATKTERRGILKARDRIQARLNRSNYRAMLEAPIY